MTNESFETLYQAGTDALDRGQYRLSVEKLEQAKEKVDLNSRLGGDVQIYLITAYQATDRVADAIALCRQLTHHPHPQIREQAKRLLYIIEAPRLKRPPEWMSEIPDLPKDINPEEDYFQGKSTPKPPKTNSFQPEDLSNVNTQDNAFVWVALCVILAILGGWLWLT